MALEISLEEIRLMKHAIGYSGEKIKRGKYVAWRNYFCSYSKCKEWERLVRLGLASKEEREKAIYYFVENKGFKVLEDVLGIKILEG